MLPPSPITDWSPLPRALEHLLQSHCTIPTLTPWGLFARAPFMAAQAAAARFPGGAGNAAFTAAAALLALSSALLPWAGWEVTPGSLLAAAALGGVASTALGAALTFALLLGMRAFLPYGSRSASCIVRSPHAVWLAYAPLDGRHGGLAREHCCTEEELQDAVHATHVWRRGAEGPAQYVVHEDALGSLQVMQSPAAEEGAALQRAATLPHKQRSVDVDGTQWLLFACRPGGQER